MSVLTKLVGNLFRARGNSGDDGSDLDGRGGTEAELLRRAGEAAKDGQLEAALELYRACIQTYPRSLDAHLGAAGVLVDLWSNDDAVEAYEKAREIAPASGQIFSALLLRKKKYATP